MYQIHIPWPSNTLGSAGVPRSTSFGGRRAEAWANT